MITSKKVLPLWAICLLACFSVIMFSSMFSSGALAQSQTTGRITGTVKDEKGAVVPGAEVTVNSKATGDARAATADSEGNYIVPLLPPGVYQVTIKPTASRRPRWTTFAS